MIVQILEKTHQLMYYNNNINKSYNIKNNKNNNNNKSLTQQPMIAGLEMTETGVKKLIIQILKNDASIALAEAADDVETGEAAAQRRSGDRIERGVGGGGGGGGGRVDRVVEEAEEVTR